MKLTDLLSTDLAQEIGALEISGISADSRLVKSGFVFAALAGSATNGEKFAKDAVAAGAVAIVASSGSELTAADLGVPVIQVEDARHDLAMMALNFMRANLRQ